MTTSFFDLQNSILLEKKSSGGKFFVQKHEATKAGLHYDLRLQKGKTYKSWAINKGIPGSSGPKHLAISTEDHSPDSAAFEGDIEKGEYGAGHVSVYDSGTYDVVKWSNEEISFVLHGKKYSGQYTLVKTKDDNWLILKNKESSKIVEMLSLHKEVPMLLAKVWDNQDIIGWWISEKLDGSRAYWDGKQLWSRNGNVFEAPEFFTKNFPPEALDGELYLGRKQFHVSSGIVRTKGTTKPDEWKRIRYYVFDAPDHAGPFESRYKFYTAACKKSPYLFAVEQKKLTSMDDLHVQLEKINKLGGEGLMARKPGSHYERIRSSTLLKVKKFQDEEGEIVGYTDGKGKYTGMLGAYIVVNKAGVKFKLSGMNDAERKNPLSIGTWITYKYIEKTPAGVPRHASLLRVYKEE